MYDREIKYHLLKKIDIKSKKNIDKEFTINLINELKDIDYNKGIRLGRVNIKEFRYKQKVWEIVAERMHILDQIKTLIGAKKGR